MRRDFTAITAIRNVDSVCPDLVLRRKGAVTKMAAKEAGDATTAKPEVSAAVYPIKHDYGRFFNS